VKIHTLPAWVDRHQVVEVEDHVTEVVRDIRRYSDRIDIYWNEEGQEFDLVERCLDGNQRLIFSVPELDGRVLDRLHRADHWYGNEVPTHILPDDEDFVSEMDAKNEQEERESMAGAMDKIKGVGEELAWALEAVNDRPSVGGSISVPKDVHA
jgi:hypothetical protein